MHGKLKRLPTTGVRADTSVDALQREADGLRSEIKRLTQEKANLALPALEGSPTARKRVAEIDELRLGYESRIELLTAAIRSLHQQARTTVPNDQYQAILLRGYRPRVSDFMLHAAHNVRRMLLGRNSQDVERLRQYLQELDAYRATAAREAADVGLPNHEAFQAYAALGDAKGQEDARQARQRYREERQQLVADTAARLLAEPLPPAQKELAALLEQARARIAIGANG